MSLRDEIKEEYGKLSPKDHQAAQRGIRILSMTVLISFLFGCLIGSVLL